MKMPIGEILDRYSIAMLKKERANAENQQEIEDSLANNYRKSNLTFNTLFKHYISNILKIEPHYTNYNPRIYRTKNQIQVIH